MTKGKIDTRTICADDTETACAVVGMHYFEMIDTGANLLLVLGMFF